MSRRIYSKGPAVLSKMFRNGFTHCTGISSALIRPGFQKAVDEILRKDNIIGLPTSAARRLFEGAEPPVGVVHSQWRARVEDFLLLCDLMEALVGNGVDRKKEKVEVGRVSKKYRVSEKRTSK